MRVAVARHQRADARRGRRRDRRSASGPRPPRSSSCSPSRRSLEARTLERARNADPRADGSDAGRRAGRATAPASARRRRADRARRGHRREAGREDPARRRGRRRRRAPSTRRRSPANRCRSTRRPGDEVFAGTINGRGALDVRVTRLRRDTTLARIIHLVERAQAQRAPAQTFVERFARVYTPAVIALAVAVAIVPPLRARQPTWHDVGLSRAGAAGRLVSVRAGDLDAGVDRRGARRRGAQGRADQGRRAPRAGRPRSAASRSTRPAR